MKIFEYLDEVSTPTGTIYVRFREKVGERQMVNGKIRNKYYLTAYAGFANSPDELKRENALRNFTINSAEDLVHMIKSIFSDKTFISVKKVVIYDDLTNPMQGDNTPVFKRNPYLLKFFSWVEREGGDKIEIVDKVGKEGPPRIKKPKKENPNKGRKIRDIPQGETKKTVTFTVGPRFYREIQNNLPNIMRYRGPNQTFVMPREIFMNFRQQAEQRFPFADIKVLQNVATGEGIPGTFVPPSPAARQQAQAVLQKDADAAVVGRAKMGITDVDESGQDKDAHTCGIVDGYYGRHPKPHKYVAGVRVNLTDPEEIKQYMAGYKDDSVGSKIYEEDDPLKARLRLTPHIKSDNKDVAHKHLKAMLKHSAGKHGPKGKIPEEVTDEGGPASRSLCRSKKPDSALGASQLSSCISQGLRAHKSGRADYVNGKQLRVGGKKIKGKAHGGPLPDYS